MSRGPGRVQRVILEAIDEPEAFSAREDGHGPVGVPFTEIYRRLYGTTEPTPAQVQSVSHAVTRLADRVERCVIQGALKPAPKNHTRRWLQHPSVIAACSDGEKTCLPCSYGSKAQPLDKYDRDIIRRVYDDEADAQITMAEHNGVHTWTDYRASERVERTRTATTRRYSVPGVSRPRTAEEKATGAAKYARLVGMARSLA